VKQFLSVIMGFFFFFTIGVPPSMADEKKNLVFDSAQWNKTAKINEWQDINPLNLETACKIAVAKNPSIAAAKARVAQAVEHLAQAKSFWWPRIDLNGSATHLTYSDNDYAKSLQTTRLFDPLAKPDKSEDIYSGNAAVQWTIFNGFKHWFTTVAARHGAEETKEALMDIKRLLAGAVGLSYHNAQLAREKIEIAKADELFNLRQIKEAEARYRVGTGSLSDVLNFKVQVNSAKSASITFNLEYEIAIHALAALLGIPDAKSPLELELASLPPETAEDMALPKIEPLIAHAIKHRPDILQDNLSVERGKSGVGAARADFFPTLVFYGSIDGKRLDNSHFEKDDFGSSVSLNLKYNLFEGGLTMAKVREAKEKHKEAVKNLENTRNTIASEVRTALSQLKSAQNELRLQRQNARLVQNNRGLVEKGYQAGQASLVRLNEAQRDFNTAMGRLALARVGLFQARHNLKIKTAE